MPAQLLAQLINHATLDRSIPINPSPNLARSSRVIYTSVTLLPVRATECIPSVSRNYLASPRQACGEWRWSGALVNRGCAPETQICWMSL